MIVDASILLYGRNDDDPRHDAARSWLESALNGQTRVGLPWQTVSAFMRIATNARAFPDPLEPEDACGSRSRNGSMPLARGCRSRLRNTAASSARWFGAIGSVVP